MELMRKLIEKAQGILARHLPPDGTSERETITALLGLLDGPESRAALAQAQPALTDAERLARLLQSFADRLVNDTRAGTIYEGDEVALREAISYLRFAGKASKAQCAAMDALTREQLTVALEAQGALTETYRDIAIGSPVVAPDERNSTLSMLASLEDYREELEDREELAGWQSSAALAAQPAKAEAPKSMADLFIENERDEVERMISTLRSEPSEEAKEFYASITAATPGPAQPIAAQVGNDQQHIEAWMTSKGLYHSRDEIPGQELPPLDVPIALVRAAPAQPVATQAHETALHRVAEQLRGGGATLPAPAPNGTIESAMNTGMCIALAIVQQEIENLPAAPPPAPVAAPELTNAARDVLAERRRQVEAEGMERQYDDKYKHEELRRAAVAYAYPQVLERDTSLWPWAKSWMKHSTPRRDAVKAAALLLAEIERIDRAAAPSAPVGGSHG